MKTRKDAARFIELLFDYNTKITPIPDLNLKNRMSLKGKKSAYHVGLVEFRTLLDFIYEGPPNVKEENIDNVNRRY